ncbi:MAG: D-2-hydroxyacid dehydrogenase [Planctomycetaceae bacterium]
MHLVIFPAIDEVRRQLVAETAGAKARVTNAPDLASALAAMPTADAFFGKLTPQLLAAAPRLRWVQSPTASLEHFLFPALTEHPCQLTNMRGIFSDVIADHVMGYVLSFARNLHLYRDQQRSGRWEPIGSDGPALPDFAQGPGVISPVDRAHLHLADCTLGVVGVGAIGEEVCRRAHAFGMRVLGVDPHPRSIANICEVAPLNQLEDLLTRSHFVVIAAPHTPQTEKLFHAATIARMRPGSYLINIGRGIIVDLSDLTSALQSGHLAGAALDVSETEPLPANHPLWQMPNVLITPHVAAASPRISERHTAVLLDNVRRFAHNEPLMNVVNKHDWY